jgi:hypothetical protein
LVDPLPSSMLATAAAAPDLPPPPLNSSGRKGESELGDSGDLVERSDHRVGLAGRVLRSAVGGARGWVGDRLGSIVWVLDLILHLGCSIAYPR